MKRILLGTITLIAFGFSTNAQNVNIPDANFKAYLVGNTSINTNMDTEIQVSEASAFTGFIQCISMSISDLTGIEAFTSLSVLECNGNPLGTLDVSSNTALTLLNCGQNQLSTLDLSNNTALTNLSCGANQLTSLDMSNHSALNRFDGGGNLFTLLNMANGNNTNFVTFYAHANPNLTCIEVDDIAYSNANWPNIDPASNFSTDCACTVNIPDANFKNYLVGNTAINTNGDTEIQCSEASAFTGSINCPNQSITDLAGVEAFTALTSLKCGLNQLTSLNVSQNTDLVQLECYSNQLTSLDVSQNAALIELTCYENQLTSLNTASNAVLTKLTCNNTSLTSLDVSQNTSLNYLRCFNNLMLTDLNVANGNNTNFSQFNATNNTSLTCIQVDDAAWSTTNWTNVDAGASFSLDCSGGVGIEELEKDKIVVYPNPTSSQITIQSEYKIGQVKVFNSFGSLVQTEYSESFSVENLPNGIYVMNIITKDRIIRSRFVRD